MTCSNFSDDRQINEIVFLWFFFRRIRNPRVEIVPKSKTPFEVFLQRLVNTVNITAFYPTGHQCTVGVFDDFISQFFCLSRVLLVHFFDAFYGLISLGSFLEISNQLSFFITQIFSDDYTDVVKFKSLSCVYTADFIDGGVFQGVNTFPKIPAHGKIADLNVVKIRIVLFAFIPVPTISRDHTGLILIVVLLLDGLVQFSRGVIDAEIIVEAF